MKRIVLLALMVMVCSMITGCSVNKEAITQMKMEKANDDVKNFIGYVENEIKQKGNGIYTFTDRKGQSYIYLNQDFLEEGRGYGDMDIKTEGNSINIYLSDNSIPPKESDEYRLYRFNVAGEYEFLKVFKNGEETYFQVSGG